MAAEGRGALVVLYAVDLDEIRRWVGSADQRRFDSAWSAVREDEEADWEPEEIALLERLLRRLVFEGRLYDGLGDDERYYLTQLLIDIFDEFVDQEAVSAEIPLGRLLEALEALPAGGEGARLARFLARGREFGGDGLLWREGPVEDVLPYVGCVSREEAGQLAAALDQALRGARGRPPGLLRALHGAAAECVRAGLDLVSFVG